ncbi:bifunctional ADP-dependent (S)-NAD(P)H-hydrate dehydratase/NAD(P)H-hydrate epimerase [Sphingomonas panacis]|uniref:Bifunctional NAD(P)H-hydrate repair enzyme n=1 Tax=Sphingomonas panacis TaxID=1560345 RepID=A0A1B3ZD20_9SPHN|nr:NAD(P)H-hydrate dehydratase [Sphingomonas panacis]AOH85320.1 bifunctional ADP-dependent (S)-NAD(P)H-hydrate dehydratase/NAD(P)H-hydrate epimerase [Sphingomonas panacis]
MIRPEGQPILTAAAMRAAEDRAIAAGSSVGALMERAGAAVAEAVRRLASGAPVLILCGPGNNGGDGYVAARVLKANGADVRIAALADPRTEAATAARAGWDGPVAPLAEAGEAPVVVDALFGTGLTRALDDAVARVLGETVRAARLSIAVDLPSGIATDTGAELSAVPDFSLTLTLGALKPAHLLQPAAARCGTVRIIDIGLDRSSRDWSMTKPVIAAPTAADHKYSRGLVVVIGGDMPGAAALASEAAMHAGAGYVMLFEDHAASTPHALVRRAWSAEAFAQALDGKRLDKTAIVVGPGLGKGDIAAAKFAAALDSAYKLVIDGDALHLLDDAAFARIKARPTPVVLTPHAGEFNALFGAVSGSKIDAARDAAARSGAIVVFKGPDTVVAHPDGRTRVALGASPWLSTAGTGDVLAGTIATMLAANTFAPAEAGVWMHSEAARRLGGAFIADDLARMLSAVRTSV